MNDSQEAGYASLPYQKFAQIGITPDLVDSLPDNVKNTLLAGGLSPVIYGDFQYQNGAVVSMPMKLQLATDNNGNTVLLAYPIYKEVKNHIGLSKKTFARLEKGEVIVDKDFYLQRDPQTNCILMAKKEDMLLDEKMAQFEKVNDIELGLEQKKQFAAGKPVELEVGGEKVVVGLDLRTPESFRTLDGDMKEWERQRAIDYDIAHPEYLGLVKTDQNRWEYQKYVEEGQGSQSLREAPRQTRTFGFGR